ncbi:hypothetical protein MKZ38_003791 [Zalerion maritima]|uniref:Uncharacterized protein n=1 Tax=Zalerion maritima TaxID=339359 RepID=A0AAD5WQ12_9PEZI|nr:hypothetical protein MKZ38_003791 [Zalerion maritima]
MPPDQSVEEPRISGGPYTYRPLKQLPTPYSPDANPFQETSENMKSLRGKPQYQSTDKTHRTQHQHHVQSSSRPEIGSSSSTQSSTTPRPSRARSRPRKGSTTPHPRYHAFPPPPSPSPPHSPPPVPPKDTSRTPYNPKTVGKAKPQVCPAPAPFIPNLTSTPHPKTGAFIRRPDRPYPHYSPRPPSGPRPSSLSPSRFLELPFMRKISPYIRRLCFFCRTKGGCACCYFCCCFSPDPLSRATTPEPDISDPARLAMNQHTRGRPREERLLNAHAYPTRISPLPPLPPAQARAQPQTPPERPPGQISAPRSSRPENNARRGGDGGGDGASHTYLTARHTNNHTHTHTPRHSQQVPGIQVSHGKGSSSNSSNTGTQTALPSFYHRCPPVRRYDSDVSDDTALQNTRAQEIWAGIRFQNPSLQFARTDGDENR